MSYEVWVTILLKKSIEWFATPAFFYADEKIFLIAMVLKLVISPLNKIF